MKMFMFSGKGGLQGKVLTALTLTLSLLLSYEAQAAISNCTLSISPAEHNYGELLKSSQAFTSTSQGNVATLATRSSNLNISCPQAERLDLRFAGTGSADGSFVWGAKGRVAITLSDAVLDGASVQLTKTKNKGVVTGDVVANSHTLSVADEITVGNNSTVKGKNLSATLTFTPYLSDQAFIVPDAREVEEALTAELLEVN